MYPIGKLRLGGGALALLLAFAVPQGANGQSQHMIFKALQQANADLEHAFAWSNQLEQEMETCLGNIEMLREMYQATGNPAILGKIEELELIHQACQVQYQICQMYIRTLQELVEWLERQLNVEPEGPIEPLGA